MSKKYIVKTVKGNRINPETGDIYDYTETSEVIKVNNEPFFMVYTDQLTELYKEDIICPVTKVLFKLLEISEFNSGKAYVNSVRIEEILNSCNISESTYFRAVSKLSKAGIINKEKTVITIAEQMFWKGDRKTRSITISKKQGPTMLPDGGGMFVPDIDEKEQDD